MCNQIKMCLVFIDFEFGKHLKQNILEAHKLHLIDVYSQYNISTNYADIPYKVTIINKLIKIYFILCILYYIYLWVFRYMNIKI